MTQKPSESFQLLGLYQLENLRRQQAKFFWVAVASSKEEVPVHSLLNFDFILSADLAAETLSREFKARELPAWWPVVLISETGQADEAVAAQLAVLGVSNVFSYKGGWTALIAGH